jgi:hypothetical protein
MSADRTSNAVGEQADAGRARAEDAADRAVSEDRLLDGEDPRTQHLDDVEHWISAYSELIAYKETLIAKTQQEAATMVNESAFEETEAVDLTLLQRELDNYRRRLRFWLGRRDELSP